MENYYVIERVNNNNYPLLEWDQKSIQFRKWKPVEVEGSVKLRLGKPVPKDPKMVDYHSLPKPVFSDKVAQVLTPVDIYGVQLIPANVDVNGKNYEYWFLHIYNKIACLDLKKSDCTTDEDDGDIIDIQRLVLDDKTLSEIPLEKRLIFVLAEYTPVYLFHESIKDAIMSVEPEGCRFFAVDEWNSDVGFS